MRKRTFDRIYPLGYIVPPYMRDLVREGEERTEAMPCKYMGKDAIIDDDDPNIVEVTKVEREND